MWEPVRGMSGSDVGACESPPPLHTSLRPVSVGCDHTPFLQWIIAGADAVVMSG